VTAVAKSTRYVEFGEGESMVRGWEATADALLVGNNQVISSAEAMCLDDEPKWSTRPVYEYRDGERTKVGEENVPLFQLRSMAQTRACAKALRNVLAWIVVLAGYAPTPAEEMDGVPGGQNSSVEPPRRKSAKSEKSEFISEAQQKRLFAIANERGVSKDTVRAILDGFGFEFSREIPKSKYTAVCAAIEKATA
jgi:hypothetical protein